MNASVYQVLCNGVPEINLEKKTSVWLFSFTGNLKVLHLEIKSPPPPRPLSRERSPLVRLPSENRIWVKSQSVPWDSVLNSGPCFYRPRFCNSVCNSVIMEITGLYCQNHCRHWHHQNDTKLQTRLELPYLQRPCKQDEDNNCITYHTN